MKDGTRRFVRVMANASSMGLAMVLATFMGLAAGWYLDKLFGTKPWLMIVFLILGIIAGFKNIYVIMKRIQRIYGDSE